MPVTIKDVETEADAKHKKSAASKKKTAPKPAAKPHHDPRHRKTTAADLAKRFNLTDERVLAELKALGMAAESPSAFIDAELLELVEHHLKDLRASLKREGPQPGDIHIKPPIVVKTLAEAIGKKPNEIITALMKMRILASVNQTIDVETAERVCATFNVKLYVDHRDKEGRKAKGGQEAEVEPEDKPFEDDPSDLVTRPPIVTFLGHVDHGKTSIQDYIRKTQVAKGEAGGITQHIGASVASFKGKTITFIDTPGHEAFTAMRARGANVTDIAVLVVAADDGFMPQTVEALNHARAAKVPIIVAINKIDLPTANPDKVLLHMQQNGLTCEEWGGDVGVARVSALTGQGMDALLERILLEAEVLELKANPRRPASGVVLEADLCQGLGATANAIVRNGTLSVGDVLLCGEHHGRVKTLIDVRGQRLKTAGPSTPVRIVGLSGVPKAGTKFIAMADEREAAEKAAARAESLRVEQLAKAAPAPRATENVMDLFSKVKRNDLSMIVKADVQGSCEAIVDSLARLPSEKIKVNVIHTGVGAVSEADILLASASQAVVVGFHTKVNPGVNDLAKREGVDIRLYSIIYELIEDIKDALEGRLDPDKRERQLGRARILKIFSMTKGPSVCGCIVEEGSIRVGAKVRVHRGKERIYSGSIQSLRRFQDDAKEVKATQECGIRLDNFLDFQEGDIIEAYDIELKKATL